MSDKKVTWGKLTKKEKKHLKEMGITTLWAFKQTADFQLNERVRHMTSTYNYEPCYDCKHIAIRLGLPV